MKNKIIVTKGYSTSKTLAPEINYFSVGIWPKLPHLKQTSTHIWCDQILSGLTMR
jgi:hypothetical protein